MLAENGDELDPIRLKGMTLSDMTSLGQQDSPNPSSYVSSTGMLLK